MASSIVLGLAHCASGIANKAVQSSCAFGSIKGFASVYADWDGSGDILFTNCIN